MKIKLLILLMWLLLGNLWAATITDTLHLNRGTFVTVDTVSLPSLAFNRNTTYASRNALIRLRPGDTLNLTFINNDTAFHGLQVTSFLTTPLFANPGDTVNGTYIFPNQGVFIYRDASNFPGNAYLGAAGMIVVDEVFDGEFFWNIREHQSDWNPVLAGGGTVNWSQYAPDYFTINGLSKPDLENDSAAVVRGSVGDTLRIYLANNGQSLHSMHFHGYHVRIVHSNQGSRRINWIKDSVPLKSGETLILEMVPDKPGKYPVHDHNLIAITGGKKYPNGMFLVMDISQ